MAKNPSEVIKQLKRERADAIRKAEADFRAARKKALSAVVEPLKDQIAELKKRIKKDTNDLAAKESELSRLLGRSAKSTGGRTRLSTAAKLDYGFKIYQHLQAKKKSTFARKDLLPLIAGAPKTLTPAKLISIWNAENKSKQIKIIKGDAPNKNRYAVG